MWSASRCPGGLCHHSSRWSCPLLEYPFPHLLLKANYIPHLYHLQRYSIPYFSCPPSEAALSKKKSGPVHLDLWIIPHLHLFHWPSWSIQVHHLPDENSSVEFHLCSDCEPSCSLHQDKYSSPFALSCDPPCCSIKYHLCLPQV